MITIKNVSKSYNGHIKAVDGLSLTIKPGEIFGFLGPNGAGKTTTIKMITGITKPDQGTIHINGKEIQEAPVSAKKEFGFVPDNPNVFLRLKGIEYLNFMAEAYNVKKELRIERIQRLSQRFSMTKALSDQINSYSHGMRQKIVIMGVLIHSPNVWILDEPMTGLDPKASHLLKAMMKEHTAQNKSVFFSTHVLEVAEKICDRVAIINQGKILYVGSVEEIKEKSQENKDLESIFLELTKDE